MLHRQSLIAATVFAFCACAAAHASDKAPKPGLSDQELDQARADLDVKLSNRAANVKQGLDKIASFQLKAEKERLDFERYMAEERKAFLLFLKSVKNDQRAKELDRFVDKQSDEREEFDKKALSAQKDWFKGTVEATWRTDSLENEPGSAAQVAASPTPAPSPAKEAPIAEKKAAPARKAVYKKKAKPTVKKKPRTEAARPRMELQAEPPAASQEQPAPASEQAMPAQQPSPDAPPPPPPGQ